MPKGHPTKGARARAVTDGSKIYPAEKDWARFWKYVEKQPNGCWLWNGAAARYGMFGYKGRSMAAHRFSYRAWPTTDPIPDTTPQLDHRCRNGLCVNPAHLDPVTNKENSLRGIGFSALNARKTHCPKGHRYTPDNTLIHIEHGRTSRKCRECHRARAKASHQRRPKVCKVCCAVSSTQPCQACKEMLADARGAAKEARRAATAQRKEARRTHCAKHGGLARVLDARGRLRCEECWREVKKRKLSANRYRDRQAAGLCVTCGRPRGERNYRCQRCHDRHMEYTHRSRGTPKRLASARLGDAAHPSQ